MNKRCGRWIFSKVRGCLMVVAEAAKGQGKGGQARGHRAGLSARDRSPWARAVHTLALSAMVTQTTLAPLSAYAQIRNDPTAPGNQRPTVLTTGNGLPQVNITTPSAAGVSRNRFSQLDVDSRGAVVNNSRTHAPTQIGGWVQGNPWLATGEASVILLEVNSGNPSQINGFIEIAGQRSEIIVANPSGLNVNGSGFINASRATLTTGEINVNEAGVSGYTVRGGTVTIGARGFDASLTDYTGILARAVAINGPLVAHKLNIVTGANQIDADGQGATPTATSGSAPSFSLDVSQLGGMYAGKITLLSTEAGVGVRNAGGIQAGDGGLSLSANGDLVNLGSLASRGGATLDNSGRFNNSGSLSATGSLNVQSGGTVTNSGQIRSGGALALQTGADLDNSGQIVAGTSATLVASGTLSNTGDMNAGAILNLQGSQLSNSGQLNAGQQVTLGTSGRFDNAGQIASQGNVQIQAPQGIGNTGSIQSSQSVALTTPADIRNSGQIVAGTNVQLTAGGQVNNDGEISAGANVDLQGSRLSNTGQLNAGQQLSLNSAGRFDNAGQLAAQGNVQIQAPQGIGNNGSIQSSQSVTLATPGDIRNSGQIVAGTNVQLTAGGQVNNDGEISAGANVDLQGSRLSNSGQLNAGQQVSLGTIGRFDNTGQIASRGNLQIQAQQGIGNSGSIQSSQSVALITPGDIRNSGQIVAGTNVQLTAGGQVDNGGEVSAGANLGLQGSQLSNTGRLNAGQQLSLSSAGRFDNAGQIVVQGGVQLLAPQGIGNTGNIESLHDISLTTAADIRNSGNLIADGALNLQAGTTVTNTGNLMGDQGVTIHNPQLIDNRGNIFSGAQTALTAIDRIDNWGLIVGDGDMHLTSGQRIDNHTGAQTYAAGQLTALTGEAILNEGLLGAGEDAQLQTRATTGRIDSTAGSVLSAGMSPSGNVPLGSGNLNLQGGTAGTVDLKGLTLAGQSIQAQAGVIDLQGQTLLTQRIDLQAGSGDLLAQNSSLQAVQQMRLDAAGHLRTDNASIGATRIDITAREWNLQGGHLLQVGTNTTDATIHVSDRIDASGATVAANASDLTLSSRDLQLNGTTLTHAGTGALALQSQGTPTVVADDALLSTSGSLQLDAATLQANRSLITAQTSVSLNVRGAMTATEATVVANGSLTVLTGSLNADSANFVGVLGDATLDIGGTVSLREGSVQSQADVSINASSIDATEALLSGRDVRVNTHGNTLNTTDGAILAARDLSITGGAIDNQRGVLQAGGNATVSATGAINNQAGQILASNALTLTSSDAIDNRSGGGTRSVIAAGAVLNLTSQGLNNQGSDIKSAGTLGIDAGGGNIDNSQGGLIAASDTLSLRGGDLDNRQTSDASQGVQARTISLNVRGLDNRSGYLLAQDQLDITGSGALDNTGGLVSSTGTLSIKDPQASANPSGKTLAIINGADGAIASNGTTEIDARSFDNSGLVVNAGDTSSGTLEAGSGNLRMALSGPLDNRAGAYVQAAGDLNASVSGVTTNTGAIEAASQLHLSSAAIVNQASGAVRAGLVDLQANTISNQGLINGGFTLLQAGVIQNTNGGRIYGDHIAIAANQLTNRGGGSTNPVIASRGDLDLGVGVVRNTEGALLLSLGDTRVGGTLDADARATGRAGAFINSSAEVEVFGNLNINAGSVQNVDAHGVSYSNSSTEHIVEYVPLDPDHPQFGQGLSAETGAMEWYLDRDEQYRADYVPNDGSPVVAGNRWLIDRYDRTTTVSGNHGDDPARISVGGNMTVNAGSTVNDKSTILIGGNFLLTGGSLQNIDGFRSTSVTEDNGTSVLSYTERRWYDLQRHWRRFFDEAVPRDASQQTQYQPISAALEVHTNPNHGSTRPQAAQAVSVASASAAPTASTAAAATSTAPVLGRPGPGVVVRTLPSGVGSSSVSGSGATNGAVNAPTTGAVNTPATGAVSGPTIGVPHAPLVALPNNALFQLRIGAPAGYLVETDPEFTQQRIWLGSDYMLTALGHDPATQTQRLGDGFYELRLVREQVAQLTGRRFLGTFTDDEAQYRALLDAGTAFAQAYQLKPGIALTREQMALLTSDIVWLIERTVQMPDGSTQRVLVPQLYALVDPSTPTLSAGLISARGVNINLSDGLFNSGTLAARENLSINAASITNVLGQMQGNNVNLRASGGITSILGQIAARQNLTMNAGGNMVFVGGGVSAGGNARLSAGGDLLLLAHDTGRQVRSQSPRDESGKPVGSGPVWSFDNSTYHQTGVDIHVGGNLSASAGGNLVAQGVSANVGGSTNLSAGGDMQLTTALNGHVQSFDFYDRYRTSGDLIRITQTATVRDINLTHSGNAWNSGGSMNLSAGGNIVLAGAQINSQGYSASAGANYSEQAAHDVREQVNSQSFRTSGVGTYLADALNNTTWLTTGGEHGGRTETARTETHIDSTRTAIVTSIDAGSGTVNRTAGGDALIEGSRISGSQVNPLTAAGSITAVAAVDTRQIEDSLSTSTIRWQSTQSTGSIQQTLHMPQIHGQIPAGASAYQGAGGVSVQLPAGSGVRQTIEQLSQQPGNGYLQALGNRSDIDWQRVEALNQSLDFSRSGLTQEATIAVIVVVSILTYGAASSAGGAAAATLGASSTGAVATAFTAGITSLASTAAVSLINNQGDIGAVLDELGSGQNMRGLLLTMATAGLSQGILGAIPLEGGGTLAGVNANSSVELLLARNTIQGISSAVLESAVMGTDLEDALRNNLQSALINTAAAQGADAIGDAALDSTSSALAHALLGCAVGAATAGSSSGCAPGAAGAAIGEIVAGLYGNGQNLGALESQLNQDPTNAALSQQVAEIRHTVTELARLSGAGAALLIGGDASSMQLAMNTASNAAVNNYLNHSELQLRNQAQQACTGGNQSACQTVRSLDQLSADRNTAIRAGVTTATEAQAGGILQDMQTTMEGLVGYRSELQTQLDNTTDPGLRASLQTQINQASNHMRQVAGLGMDYLAQQYQNTGNPLYQSAFAQLSAASNGNELADAMASVMGVQLARPPSSAPNTPPASVATGAKPSQNDTPNVVAGANASGVSQLTTAERATGGQVIDVNPAELRWTQTTAGGNGRADAMRTSMAENGYNGPPIDVVRTPSGIVTVDHTRAAVALEQGITSIPATLHLPTDLLPANMAGRFGSATTWGEAAAYRAANQRPPLPAEGTPTPPKLPPLK